MRLSIHPTHPEPRKIRRAAEMLMQRAPIAFPTDTVYALGCSIQDKRAIEKLYRLKDMPANQPLAFLCPDLSDIARYAHVDNQAYRILRRLLPGPYCFILPASREVPKIVMRKRKTVGIRVPDSPIALALLREVGSPLISSSATWNGEQLREAEDIEDRFRSLSLVIDAGPCGLLPSTLVDLTTHEPQVLREGAGPIDAL